jgi:hypothetical protein
MDERLIEGTWEEVSERHGSELKGHRVQVRVIDRNRASNFDESAWNAARELVQKLMAGKPRIMKLLKAEDIYEGDD